MDKEMGFELMIGLHTLHTLVTRERIVPYRSLSLEVLPVSSGAVHGMCDFTINSVSFHYKNEKAHRYPAWRHLPIQTGMCFLYILYHILPLAEVSGILL